MSAVVRWVLRVALVTTVIVTQSACDYVSDQVTEWRESKKPGYIAPECRYPYGHYFVYAGVTWSSPMCEEVVTFSNLQTVWWGGSNTYGPDARGERLAKGKCSYEYAEPNFVGFEERTKADGIYRVSYKGTWRISVPTLGLECVAHGEKVFERSVEASAGKGKE